LPAVTLPTNAPAAAIVTGLPFGVATLDARAILGTAIVAIGLVAGLWSAARQSRRVREAVLTS